MVDVGDNAKVPDIFHLLVVLNKSDLPGHYRFEKSS
jgi:hypothetical protein